MRHLKRELLDQERKRDEGGREISFRNAKVKRESPTLYSTVQFASWTTPQGLWDICMCAVSLSLSLFY